MADVILRGAVRAQGSLTTLTTCTPRPPAVRRLDELSLGLAKEVVLWKVCNDPLLYLECWAYLGAGTRWPAWRRLASCWPRPGSGWSTRRGSAVCHRTPPAHKFRRPATQKADAPGCHGVGKAGHRGACPSSSGTSPRR
jgi:hypothetical protein